MSLAVFGWMLSGKELVSAYETAEYTVVKSDKNFEVVITPT